MAGRETVGLKDTKIKFAVVFLSFFAKLGPLTKRFQRIAIRDEDVETITLSGDENNDEGDEIAEVWTGLHPREDRPNVPDMEQRENDCKCTLPGLNEGPLFLDKDSPNRWRFGPVTRRLVRGETGQLRIHVHFDNRQSRDSCSCHLDPDLRAALVGGPRPQLPVRSQKKQ